LHLEKKKKKKGEKAKASTVPRVVYPKETKSSVNQRFTKKEFTEKKGPSPVFSMLEERREKRKRRRPFWKAYLGRGCAAITIRRKRLEDGEKGGRPCNRKKQSRVRRTLQGEGQTTSAKSNSALDKSGVEDSGKRSFHMRTTKRKRPLRMISPAFLRRRGLGERRI